MPHSGFDHRFGRRGAILFEKVFFERTAVDADADRHFAGLGGTNNLADAVDVTDIAGINA